MLLKYWTISITHFSVFSNVTSFPINHEENFLVLDAICKKYLKFVAFISLVTVSWNDNTMSFGHISKWEINCNCLLPFTAEQITYMSMWNQHTLITNSSCITLPLSVFPAILHLNYSTSKYEIHKLLAM